MPKDTTPPEVVQAIQVTPDPANTVLIEVLERGLEIAGHKKAAKHRERIPVADAKALETLGKVRIVGI